MRIHFVQHTRYNYSKPVTLLPQFLRMRPREDGFQKLLAYTCAITPGDHHQAPIIDVDGNTLNRAWFDSATSRLDIRCEGIVETYRDNPYAFILDPEALRLPLKGLALKHPSLLPSLMLTDSQAKQKKTRALAALLLKGSKGDTLDYISGAMRHLSQRLKRLVRLEGEAWAPEETLKKGQGSCRDLAVLFMELCRLQGLPARFASGYFLEHPSRRQHDLHAWAEVYLPGAGWRGFDPTCALACASAHVTLCAAARPADCAPLTGSFAGSAKAELSASLELKG